MTGEIDARESARLLRLLGEPGTYGVVSALGCGRIALYRDRSGTSLGAGHVAAEAAAVLVAEGSLRWTGEGRGRRLVLNGAPSPRGGPVAEPSALPSPPALRIDDRESPLLWLHRRPGKDGKPQISDAEFAAGERFRADLTRAQMLPRTTMNWDAALTPEERAAGPRDPAGASDAAIAARQRVRRACERLGPELSGLAIDVCGFLKGLDLVERERHWPARSAKVVLRVALASLAAHYGTDRTGKPSGLTAWQAADARPTIAPAAER